MNIPSRIVLAGATLTLAVAPVAAFAHGSTQSAAVKQCAQERTTMGKTAFDLAYGTNKNKSNAFGKCAAHRTSQDATDQQIAQSNAAKTCRTERAADSTAFNAKYGTNKNGQNAFGKCVSSTAKTMSDRAETGQTKAEDNAAKTCRTERVTDPATFKTKYGTNKNQSNAFGKCVSTTAKALEQQSGSSS